MKRNWIYAWLILHLITSVLNESYYSIVAPGTIKSNRKFSVAVTLHDDATEPASIRIGIVGPSYNDTKQVDVRVGETKQVDFLPPKLLKGTYKLVAEGLSGVRFTNDSILNVDTESGPYIYIQLDKAYYKPMDLVQFRAVVLDEHTRPLNISEPIRVEILDANDNRVKQYKDITLVKGVYTDKLQLSSHPALGVWKIVVVISGKYAFSQNKLFHVDKYVLPRFSVHIQTADSLTPDEKVIKAFVYGKYTFDKYVEGNATVVLTDGETGVDLQEKQLNIEHMNSVEFDLSNDKDLQSRSHFTLLATLSEKHTGRVQTNSMLINIRKQHYNVEVRWNDIDYRGSRPYRLKAMVRHWNGAPVLDSSTKVYMEYGNRTYETHLNEKGVATFNFEHDPTSELTIRYKDSTYNLSSIFVYDEEEENNSILQLSLKGEDGPRLGEMIEIEINSTSDIPYIVYTVTSHSNIIHMEYVKLKPNQKSHIIKIRPSIEMVPRSFVYVHYVQNGNLQYKEMTLDLPQEFENQISVEAPAEVPPGSEVTINIKAQPNSYVCILAVDLSVYLFDSSYDLDRRIIINALFSDRTYTPVIAYDYPGIISGLITMSNAHFPFASVDAMESPMGGGALNVDVRSKFPETWIFKNIQVTMENTQLTLNVPDTITTWRITAFSLHDVTGFGIVDDATNIVTIKPFFVDLNLPYSIKRGEFISLPITVFNYHSDSVNAEVTMYSGEQQEFEFVDATQGSSVVRMKRELKETKQMKQTKSVTVPADGVESVSFMIRPKQVGEIDLNVSAKCELSSDAVLQKLKVDPEGVGATVNKAMLIRLARSESINSTLSVTIPEAIVAETEHLTLSMGGDNLAPTLGNLNGLVQRPTGCGEQNMVNFAPNILVLQYLKTTGKSHDEKKLVQAAKQYVDIGYQQELSYRHSNGGFSVFGEKKDKGKASTWLTAYAIRFFIKAAKFTSIEERIIESGLDYLQSNQLASGEFAFTGYLFYPAQQNRFGFTAFVLMTFLEKKKYAQKYDKVIQKALNFLNSNINKMDDVYALSIMAVSLQMAKNDNAQNVLDKLKQQSKEAKGMRWWSTNDKNGEKDVEITAYTLMALLETDGDHIPVLKWLTEQRNGNGGFKSTHDTVVGLQALVKYSEKANTANGLKMQLKYVALDEEGTEMKSDEFLLDGDNSLQLQMHRLPRSTRSIKFNATGSGQSLLQLTSSYYVATGPPVQHFLIKPKGTLVSTKTLDLEICFTYQVAMTPDKSGDQSEIFSNMVIMEVNLPTGFRSDAEFSNDLLDNELIQRIVSKNSDSTIIVYLDNLLANETNCINIEADKTHDAMKLKPAAIVMFDYYNSSRTNTEFYNIV